MFKVLLVFTLIRSLNVPTEHEPAVGGQHARVYSRLPLKNRNITLL